MSSNRECVRLMTRFMDANSPPKSKRKLKRTSILAPPGCARGARALSWIRLIGITSCVLGSREYRHNGRGQTKGVFDRKPTAGSPALPGSPLCLLPPSRSRNSANTHLRLPICRDRQSLTSAPSQLSPSGTLSALAAKPRPSPPW